MSATCARVTPSLPSSNPNASRTDERLVLLTRTDGQVKRTGMMTTLKHAGEELELLLKSIPFDEDRCFNVIGFGSAHAALFPKSTAYNAESLKESTAYT